MAAPRGGLAAGILQGQQIFQNFHGQFQQAAQQRELDEVNSAQPVESKGFTPEDGQQLDSIVKQGFDNVTFDDATKAYVAKNTAGETKTVPMSGSFTDYLGQRTAGPMSSDQQKSLRLQAVADVIGRRDPAKGLQMSLQAQQGIFAAKKQARDEKQWAREDDIESIDKELGSAFEKGLVGPDGQRRTPTAEDYLGATQQRALRLAQAGHVKEAEQAFRENAANAHIKIQMDAAERKVAAGKAAAALAAGDYTQLADVYNRFVPSGDKVTGIEAGKDGQLIVQRTGLDGKPAAPFTLKNQGEALAMLKSLDDPMALYQYSQHELQNQLRLRAEARADNADRRADRADSRAASAHGLAMADRSERLADRRDIMSTREALAREQDPNISEAGARAARLGLIQIPGTGKGRTDIDVGMVRKFFTPDNGAMGPQHDAEGENKFWDFVGKNKFRTTDEALMAYVQQERPRKVESKAEVDKLPSGSKFVDPNGVVRIKP
ncbi:hypothetical protein [Paracidovorax oryzae]|uniref:hypothetical protein n=1 Tax=Paracidovorax oryzae TaxID=862720 RepID=UPI0002FCC0A8|nr:hypothetical protein [Paracidovorax oryzae]